MVTPRALADALATPLSQLSLNARMRHWIERHELNTLGELVQRSPYELIKERNLGRKSIADTREVIEPLLGARWEIVSKEVARASSPKLDRQSLGDVLETPLIELKLTTRMRNWTQRQGMLTLRQLASCKPSELEQVRNVGPKSLLSARREIEALLGLTWEHVSGGLARGDVPRPRLKRSELLEAWDACRSRVRPALGAMLIADLGLPPPLPALAREKEWSTLDDLLEKDGEQLAGKHHLSLELIKTLLVHFDHLTAELEREEERMANGLVASFATELAELPPMQSQVLRMRYGLSGSALTAREVGKEIGKAEHTVFNLENDALARLRRRLWCGQVRQRALSLIAEGPIPIAHLARHDFFRGSEANLTLLCFLFEKLLRSGFVVDLDEEAWLSPLDEETLRMEVREVRKLFDATPLPRPLVELEREILDASEDLGPILQERLLREIGSRWLVTPPPSDRPPVRTKGIKREPIVIGRGSATVRDLFAIVCQSPVPIPVSTLEPRFRDAALEPPFVHYGRGLVGLPQHFPDREKWRRRLIPAAEAAVRRAGPERQWDFREIFTLVRERISLPEWLDAWYLLTLLRDHTNLVPLPGRGRRFALGGAGEHLTPSAEVERVLREAGRPLDRGELKSRLHQRIGPYLYNLPLLFRRRPFVQLDGHRVGLFDRDVPGGPPAAEQAILQLSKLIETRREWINKYDGLAELRRLSPATYREWSPTLLASVVRGDGRLAQARDSFGLRAWE